jgi:hypothetical protein
MLVHGERVRYARIEVLQTMVERREQALEGL